MPTRANEEYVKGFEDSPEMMMKMKPTAAAAAVNVVVPVSNEYAMIALCVFVSLASPLIVTFARAVAVVRHGCCHLFTPLRKCFVSFSTSIIRRSTERERFCLRPVRDEAKTR